MIESWASSASEVLFRLLDKEKISKAVAECLYTGIAHDTGIFKYSNTSRQTMEIAGFLMETGIDFPKIIDDSFFAKTYGQAKLHGRAVLDSVRILDGTFDLTTTKDGIHASNDDDETLGYIYIAGGDFTISSQDDGMHADSALYIEDGTIDITESYEGLEGQTITILDGTISIVSSDDGINASSGSSASSGNEPQKPDGNRDTDTPPEKREFPDGQQPSDMTPPEDGQMPSDMTPPNDGQQPSDMTPPGGFGGNGGFDMDADESCSLTISGGDISIDAGGDGIDSNGYFYMTGGNVFVAGPESNGDSALDYGISASISGGTFLSTGYSGMAQSFSDDSEQCSYMIKLDTMVEADSSILTLTGAEGVVLLSHTTNKSYNCVIVSCPELTSGATYTLTTGSISQEITP